MSILYQGTNSQLNFFYDTVNMSFLFFLKSTEYKVIIIIIRWIESLSVTFPMVCNCNGFSILIHEKSRGTFLTRLVSCRAPKRVCMANFGPIGCIFQVFQHFQFRGCLYFNYFFGYISLKSVKKIFYCIIDSQDYQPSLYH